MGKFIAIATTLWIEVTFIPRPPTFTWPSSCLPGEVLFWPKIGLCNRTASYFTVMFWKQQRLQLCVKLPLTSRMHVAVVHRLTLINYLFTVPDGFNWWPS